MKSVSRSVFWGGGFSPCSLYFIFQSVPKKIYLGNPYTIRKILLSSFRVFSSFFGMGFFFEEIFHFPKTTEFSRKGSWRTVKDDKYTLQEGEALRMNVTRKQDGFFHMERKRLSQDNQQHIMDHLC